MDSSQFEKNKHIGSLPRDSSKIKKPQQIKIGVTLGRLTNGESSRRNELKFDVTPYEVKVARTVWSGGKGGDYLKSLPIAIE